jgi:hypothetical protein
VLFLLRDREGKALMIAQAGSKTEAEAFGAANVPLFCGESLELEGQSRSEAEEFWGVLTVQVPAVNTSAKKSARRPAIVVNHIWVRGLELPEEVEEDDLLTPEDRRDLALDHIARTSNYVARIEIRKWAGAKAVR